MSEKYLRVRVQGGPRDRGRQHGEQARHLIHRSIEGYQEMFAAAGISWEEGRAAAEPYVPFIRSFGDRYLEELEGIAAGAGVDFEDVLTINVRSEILQAAKAAGPECSGIVALPARTRTGHTYIAQNWDNAPHTAETVVVLEVTREDGPDFITVVEAGLLAKTGVNTAGVGVGTNALITEHDADRPAGIPLHVLLRSVLDSESVVEAADRLRTGPRACSANYLIASSAGEAIDIEAAPGGIDRQWSLEPANGLILHTNHFTSASFDMKDMLVRHAPDSLVRLEQVVAAMSEASDIDEMTIQSALTDHGDYPRSVCCHQDPAAEAPQAVTMASIVIDLDTREMWLAEGNPCETGYQRLDHSLVGI